MSAELGWEQFWACILDMSTPMMSCPPLQDTALRGPGVGWGRREWGNTFVTVLLITVKLICAHSLIDELSNNVSGILGPGWKMRRSWSDGQGRAVLKHRFTISLWKRRALLSVRPRPLSQTKYFWKSSCYQAVGGGQSAFFQMTWWVDAASGSPGLQITAMKQLLKHFNGHN